MTEIQEKLVERVLDRFLFAVIVASVVALFARSLEHLKTSLAWGNEIMKERLSSAKALTNGLRDIQSAHEGIVVDAVFHGRLSMELFRFGPEYYLKAIFECPSQECGR